MDEMLDSISPEVMDEWLAYESLDPDPLDRIAEILKRGFTYLCLMQGTEDCTIEPSDFEPDYGTPKTEPREDKQPRKRKKGKRKKQRAPLEPVSPNQGAALMAASFGAGQPSPLQRHRKEPPCSP